MKRYPLIEEIANARAAPQAFEFFQSDLYAFFLDSGMDPQRLGRYSFISSEPFLVLRSRGNQVTLIWRDKQEVEQGNPFDVLGRLLATYKLDSFPAPIPFCGGAVGYLSYDICHFIERLPATAVDDLELPECYFGFYDLVLAFDNLEGKVYIISTGFPELNENARIERAKERLDEIRNRAIKASSTGDGSTGDTGTQTETGATGTTPAPAVSTRNVNTRLTLRFASSRSRISR